MMISLTAPRAKIICPRSGKGLKMKNLFAKNRIHTFPIIFYSLRYLSDVVPENYLSCIKNL